MKRRILDSLYFAVTVGIILFLFIWALEEAGKVNTNECTSSRPPVLMHKVLHAGAVKMWHDTNDDGIADKIGYYNFQDGCLVLINYEKI